MLNRLHFKTEGQKDLLSYVFRISTVGFVTGMQSLQYNERLKQLDLSLVAIRASCTLSINLISLP